MENPKDNGGVAGCSEQVPARSLVVMAHTANIEAANTGEANAESTVKVPFRIGLSILHLATMGVIGIATLTVLITFLATGISLVPVLGIGLLLIVAFVYATFGVAWFETNRVASLYKLSIPALRFVKHEPGFKGYIASLWQQLIDARMWRAIASFAIASGLGIGVIGLAQTTIRSWVWIISGRLAERNFAETFGVEQSANLSITLNIAIAIAAPVFIILLAMLHRIVSKTFVADGVNEAELRDKVKVTSEQRQGAVRAADVERTRIERDLHDGIQPRLVSIGMTLGLAKETIDSDPEGAKKLIEEAHTSTKSAVTELRQLARGIHTSVLDDRGLDASLSALAARSHIPVTLDVQLGDYALSKNAQAAVYFAIAESLTNAAKHSRASEARVTVRLRDTETDRPFIWARVEDNGVGGAVVQPGGGLDGIINRIMGVGGNSQLDSPRGGPTTLQVNVPCAS